MLNGRAGGRVPPRQSSFARERDRALRILTSRGAERLLGPHRRKGKDVLCNVVLLLVHVLVHVLVVVVVVAHARGKRALFGVDLSAARIAKREFRHEFDSGFDRRPRSTVTDPFEGERGRAIGSHDERGQTRLKEKRAERVNPAIARGTSGTS